MDRTTILLLGLIVAVTALLLYREYYHYKKACAASAQSKKETSGYVQSRALSQQLRAVFDDLLKVSAIPTADMFNAFNSSNIKVTEEVINEVLLKNPETLVFRSLFTGGTGGACNKITLTDADWKVTFVLMEETPGGPVVPYFRNPGGAHTFPDLGFNRALGTSLEEIPIDRARMFIHLLTCIVDHHRAIHPNR